MRNWNPILVLTVCQLGLRFEPTYEELKQTFVLRACLHADVFWAYLWGIETDGQHGHGNVLGGFEPTYEELKHVTS